MPLTYPLTLDLFADILSPVSATMHAPFVGEMSQTAGGEVLTRRLGTSLWQGTVALAPDYREKVRAIRGRIETLAAQGGSFLMRDLAYVGPAGDPRGTILGSGVPTLGGVTGQGDVSINALPGNYWLRAGDYFSFTYGTNPVRYALHQVVRDQRAGSGGTVSNVIVHPPIRPGWAAGAAITLIKPVCKALIVPGSVTEGVYGPVAMSGLSFRWQQTLR